MPPKKPKPVLFLDVETYKDYFLIQFYNPVKDKFTYFELTDDLAPNTSHADDVQKVLSILRTFCIVTFNGINYDLPLLFAYLQANAEPARQKKISDAIILSGQKWWHIERNFGFRIDWRMFDQIDLIEIAPGKASLKLYGGRMHCKKLQDLPIEPNESLSIPQRALLREYCANDLRITHELYKALKPQIELREKMSMEYKVDLRSKSDAQIAEAVISKTIQKETGHLPTKREVRAGTKIKYVPPAFIKFESAQLQCLLQFITGSEFMVMDNGKIMEPEGFKQPVEFYGNHYNLGIGGLHSSEESVGYVKEEDWLTVDRDCTAFYPNIILNCALYPEHLGDIFLRIYKEIVDKRVKAKKDGQSVIADSLKITINGCFGKLGSKYSFLFSPQLLLQVTLTGQLLLLMLIERLSYSGCPVLSANTDGVTFKCLKKYKHQIDELIGEWEKDTGFQTEETQYRAVFHANVNNYIAIKTDGKIKSKGAYTPAALQKNPTCEVCVDAVIEFLRSNVTLEHTITNCKDIRKFVSVRKVAGGAVQGDTYLGRVVRFYYSKNNFFTINYKINGYLVPKTVGAKPCMDLPDAFPEDIDYDVYIKEAEGILESIGATLW